MSGCCIFHSHFFDLFKLIIDHKEYFSKSIEGVDLILCNGKIFIPHELSQRILHWYHDNLCHPGAERLKKTISQYMIWPNLSDDMDNLCKKCHPCQIYELHKQKYGLLPPKDVLEDIPWHTLCVDLIGPYKVQQKMGIHIPFLL